MADLQWNTDERRAVGSTAPVEELFQQAFLRIAESDCPVLILGEPGAGKRSMAARLHAHSMRSHADFHEIRSQDASVGSLEAAISSNGTVYLSEIYDLGLVHQELILDSFFHSKPLPSCRLLCGSSRDLGEEVKSWRLREDLYHHLSAITLRIPPLRFRRPEILTLAEEFLTRYSTQFDRPKPVLCPESIQHLMEHPWPGNLPELQTAIKTFVAIGDQAISLAAIKAATALGRSNGNHRHLLLKEATRASAIKIERQLISEVLVSTGGNRKRAAAELGISYKALLYKLKQIESERPSASSQTSSKTLSRNGAAL
jgi:DNA-binding NtrC family response regulator